MSFEEDYAKTIQKFLLETRGQNLTIEEILSRPKWKRVMMWWKALEHYEGNPMPKLSIDEVKDIYGE